MRSDRREPALRCGEVARWTRDGWKFPRPPGTRDTIVGCIVLFTALALAWLAVLSPFVLIYLATR